MRRLIVLLSILTGTASPAFAQVSIGIGLPNLSIGINLPLYPQFEPVQGYPVYYAPQVASNYFFYDGMYWVYQSDNWYASSWYNGPWAMVSPMYVPVYILRVPVRYYRYPPGYFHGWRQDDPPRWGDHWGNDWQRQRNGWDHWNRNAIPAAAPLPAYQRQYSGGRYPSYEQQRTLNGQNNHYQPHDPVVQQHYQQYVVPKGPAPSRQEQLQHPQQKPQPQQRQAPPQQQPPQQHQQQQPPGQDRNSQGRGESAPRDPKQDQGKDKGGDKGGDKSQGNDGHGDNR